MANHLLETAKKIVMMHNNSKSTIVTEGETLRPESDLPATEEEHNEELGATGSNETTGPKPKGRPAADLTRKQRLDMSCKISMKVGTWNVRSMQSGKLDVIQGEMKRMGIAIMGLCETRWKRQGHFSWNGFKIVMSGQEERRRNGVALMCDKKSADAIMGYNTVSDRILSVRFRGGKVNTTIMQIYAPTSMAAEEEQEAFYIDLQSTIDKTPKGDILMIMGDFNAKVGEDNKGRNEVLGRYGLGKQNEAGERLVEFCASNELRIMNTWFEQPKRRLYTWTTPDGKHRNQIDYMLVNKRWKSTIKDVRTRPGADCGTDHELLVATLKLKMKKLRKGDRLTRYDCKGITPEYRIEVKNRFETLEREEAMEEEDVNIMWTRVKEILQDAAEKYVPKKLARKTTPWLSEEAIKVATERREAKKTGNKERVKVLNRTFQKKAREDKENHLNEMCRELEEDGKKGRTKEMFAKIKKITKTAAPRMGSLKTKDGKIIGDEDGIKERWREYTEELYKEDKRVVKENINDEEEFEKEPTIMEAEVEWAIRQLKDNKAPGLDGIPIELIKEGEEAVIKTITKICNQIWRTGEWPEDWKSSVFIPIFKKGDARECENYRTIAMISHTSKILLKIIHKRMENTIERELPVNQAGFRKARGTRDHIANIRWIMERQREYGQEVHMCFIDYSKAFDCIDHTLLWKTLIEMGIPMHLVKILKGLYVDQGAVLRTEYGDTGKFKVRKGVRQGCILSPFLFNLYAERIMRNAGLEETTEGVKIAGKILNNLRYADDTTLLAGKKNDLVELIRRVKRESEKAGLYFNIKKTKIMTTAAWESFEVDGEEIEVVASFTFLGSMIEKGGRSEMEIKRRITLGKTAMNGLSKIWKDKHVSVETKKRLVRALIFPVVMYGCESWTKTQSMEKKINACEMWIWRKMLRISWTEKRTNESVRKELGIEKEETLQQSATKWKLCYFGHVMRSNGLEKELMTACGEGRRRRGRPRIRWLDEVQEKTGMNLEALREATRERRNWRKYIYTVVRAPRAEDTR